MLQNQSPETDQRCPNRRACVARGVLCSAPCAPVPLRGLVDTGLGLSILAFFVFNRLARQTGNVKALLH